MALRPPIQKRLQVLEAKTQALFQFVESVPDELLTAKPEPNYWNALEALNHIYLGEKLSMQYVKYKLSKPETIPRRKPDALLRTLLLKWILHSPLKFKSPAPINMRTDQPVMRVEELKKAWAQLRGELNEILRVHEPGLSKALPYKQPYAGRMTLHQMLIFFEDHLVHHTRQIHRIIHRVSS